VGGWHSELERRFYYYYYQEPSFFKQDERQCGCLDHDLRLRLRLACLTDDRGTHGEMSVCEAPVPTLRAPNRAYSRDDYCGEVLKRRVCSESAVSLTQTNLSPSILHRVLMEHNSTHDLPAPRNTGFGGPGAFIVQSLTSTPRASHFPSSFV
jgi:hypothetical protein